MAGFSTRKLWIEGPVGRLEAVVRLGCPVTAAAVLAHPHPLHGGSLHNPVVFHADRELGRAGWSTLRFNFRGVGTSEGTYDEGRGELQDLDAVVSWLRGPAAGKPLLIVGYSFGSWCAIRHAATDPDIAGVAGVVGVVAIGLPLASYAFDEEIAKLRAPLAVVQGSDDELGRPDAVQALVARASGGGKLFVVPGSTHLFPGAAPRAASAVVEAASWCIATCAGSGT